MRNKLDRVERTLLKAEGSVVEDESAKRGAIKT